ncbi:MAG TPA: hypothetical protein VHX87_04195 [Galbitalea sp.]|jgi:hypothetical protein|nr:hypothetical protein [Galbitalea sp.]
MFVRLSVACVLLVVLGLCAIFAAARIPVFSVRGDLASRLEPGVAVPLDLVISNEHSYPVRVRSMVVTVTAVDNGSSDPRHQCAVTNFSVTQAVGLTPVMLKPHSRVTLADLGVTTAHWPKVKMLQVSKRAQAECKNARLTLQYSAPGWFWTE